VDFKNVSFSSGSKSAITVNGANSSAISLESKKMQTMIGSDVPAGAVKF
jgi:hypothetical protein